MTKAINIQKTNIQATNVNYLLEIITTDKQNLNINNNINNKINNYNR